MAAATPVATYRLQLTANFDFDAARAIVPYLKALGISHLYDQLSYRARRGVLLPILGTSYGKALENGEIELRYDAGEGELHINGYSLEGPRRAGKARIPLSELFSDLPAAAIEATALGATKPAAKRMRQHV